MLYISISFIFLFNNIVSYFSFLIVAGDGADGGYAFPELAAKIWYSTSLDDLIYHL